jgi:hypothetical protein
MLFLLPWYLRTGALCGNIGECKCKLIPLYYDCNRLHMFSQKTVGVKSTFISVLQLFGMYCIFTALMDQNSVKTFLSDRAAARPQGKVSNSPEGNFSFLPGIKGVLSLNSCRLEVFIFFNLASFQRRSSQQQDQRKEAATGLHQDRRPRIYITVCPFNLRTHIH